MGSDRRTFIKIAGLTVIGLGARSTIRAMAGEEAPQEATSPILAPAKPLEAINAEPKTGAPLVGARWAMVVDSQKCMKQKGCKVCQEACHLVHNVPKFDSPKEEIKWIWREPFANAFPEQPNNFPAADYAHSEVAVLCNHCENPPCVRVCPTKATWKRPDGIVTMDMHRCIGCRFCMAACPYGSRSFNWRDPRAGLDMAHLKSDYPTRTRGVVEKCTFCVDRLAFGLQPACVEACPTQALVFGDLDDPGSAVRKLLEARYTIRRNPSLGTEPKVYYIV